jgi:radical SAM superfamily enzyme YgiQ (UPF0313 family)
MRVLFVYTDIDVKGGARSYHFGLGVLSSTLKAAGHQTELHYMFDLWDPEGFAAHVERFDPTIIAYTADSSQIRHVAKLIRSMAGKGYFQIAGGAHPSFYPKCLENIDGLDAVCLGEGEIPLTELAGRMEAGKDYLDIANLRFKLADGSVRENPRGQFIHELDAIPFGDRDMFDYQTVVDSDYDRATVMMSRGCPYQCSYCGAPAMGALQEGKYVRFRSVENGIAEIKDVVARFKVKSIFFADDVFTIDRKYVKAFAEAYAKEIGLPFEVTTRVESSNYETFRHLADAGCTRVALGVESGNEEFRRTVLRRKMTNQKIIEAFKDAKRAGLKTKSYNIVGFPHETRAIHMDTVRLNQQLETDSVVCYIFNPYPGTALYDLCLKEGYLSEDYFDKDFISRTDTPLNIPGFPREEILELYHNFAYNVYKEKSLMKALIYKAYYSSYGEWLIRALDPLKKPIRKLAMGS